MNVFTGDISDFILARVHRLYHHANALERWFSSQFKSNPVGLPRTRSKSKNSRNYTPHGIRLYRAYGKRSIIGIARARLSQLDRCKQKLQYTNPEAPEIELNETWINIRRRTYAGNFTNKKM